MADYQGTHTGQQIDSAVDNFNAFKPDVAGANGQILTMGEEKPYWATPAVGGIENVTIQISVETGTGSIVGVPISVSVEGENSPRSLVTDANGKVKTNITMGLQYTVTFGSISGYLPVSSLTYRASLPTRVLTGVYREDATVTQEHVVIDLVYTSQGTARATAVSVQTNSGTTSHAVVNNRCEFDLPLGVNYTLIFPAVEGFATPANQSYTSAFRAKYAKATYIGAITNLAWIKASDGSTVPFNDLTLENCDSFVGLRVSSSLLAQQQSSFVVPMSYLVSQNVVREGQTIITATTKSATWGPQVLLEQLPCYTSAGAATTPDAMRNLDGENNTSVFLAEAAAREIGSLPAMAWCREQSYTINGITKVCFLGSYAQMKALSDNVRDLNLLFYNILGVQVRAFNSGNWWTSTQSSQANAVYLNYGGFNLNTVKGYSTSVVPFLAY